MKLSRTLAATERTARMHVKSPYRIIELVYEPVMPLIMWGIFLVAARNGSSEFANLMLGVQILWSFAFLVQLRYNIITLEDLWNRSLKEVFTAPLSVGDYIASKVIVSLASGLIALALLLGVSSVGFNYSAVFSDPLGLAAILASAAVASIAIGIVLDGIIIWLGHEYSFLSWSTAQVFITLSCPFYSIGIFPAWLHPIIMAMPYYWQFDALKGLLVGATPWDSVWTAFSLAIVYMVVGVPLYILALKQARINGSLSKN